MTAEMQTYHIITYGCQMNDNDSEIMAGILEAKGFVPAQSEQSADVIVVNTCVVREGAEERAVGRLANLLAVKKKRPHTVIAVAGCMAQKEGEQLFDRLPCVDLVIGTRDLFKLGRLLDEFRRTGRKTVSIDDVDQPAFFDGSTIRRGRGVKALTTIMYGCDNFCSYCIVPRTRGREVSRPQSQILEEIRALAGEGYREVLLLGQNVNSYRDEGTDFAGLLEKVSSVDGLERIRFITSHPKDCSDRLLDAVAALPKVCEWFHLPVQAGSNRVLRRMRRLYTRDHYLALLRRIRERMTGAAITTDVIVGFPDETEEEFCETFDLLEQARWDSAFIFMYSPREGTTAASWKDSVPLQDKKRRLQKCLARQEEIGTEINRSMVGQTVEILVEDISRRSDKEVVGRTRGDKSVIVPGGPGLIGRLLKVRIVDAASHTLFGQSVEQH